ncbi:uncharacterized protein UV8b_02956 [Ustilaginoidea virens]|uniref:Uncharacterized protein n=1 Tax=Ustilaginoidea virens TaxID=1159556 RepID=A0A8E5HNF6_USTVR|nr:uncharacterized protein UV8b_02956 [Ustilaginoidea virens]QUC18715.1 hypothetical protein UV8b_02956 [Ustilaginoidea virens]
MSLSRAFTTRRLRQGSDLGDSIKMPQRSNTVTRPVPPNIRDIISAPVQLIHTTNMLSYNAPDIPRAARSNSRKSSNSGSDADSQTTADTTPPTSPDVSSPQPNHLSCYFKTGASPLTALMSDAEPPAIPKRSPSHTKKNSYEAIAHQRSVSRKSRESDRSMSIRSGLAFSRSPSTTSTRASSVSHASVSCSRKQVATPPPPCQEPSPAAFSPVQPSKDTHPFGQELAQVTELAEEYVNSSRLCVIDEEQQYLTSRGLCKFSPSDYMSAIQDVAGTFFPERIHATSTTPLWI